MQDLIRISSTTQFVLRMVSLLPYIASRESAKDTHL
jgi:hypothetical protein